MNGLHRSDAAHEVAVSSCARTPLPKARARATPAGGGTQKDADRPRSGQVPKVVVSLSEMSEPTVAVVLVHVYDISELILQEWRTASGTQFSPYHTGLEVFGQEWSCPMPHHPHTPAGILCYEPTECPHFRLRNSLSFGYTACPPKQVFQMVEELKAKWGTSSYSVFGWNCHNFVEEMCKRLGVGRLPRWVKETNDAPRARVILRVYDLGQTIITRGYNAMAKSYGAFHSGIEVYGREWSFGMTEDDDDTGVAWNPPGECPCHSFREMISMGWTALSEKEVEALIDEMKAEWMGRSYDLFSRNCHNFSEAFCARLGVAACLPSWVNTLASSLAPDQPRAES